MPARKLSISVAAILLFILPVTMLTTTAPASVVLELSTHSSEPGIPAADLSATLEFEVVGSELTLTVTNQSSQFNIRRIYFNADDSVTGMNITSGDSQGWAFTENIDQVTGQNTMADGFGVYSFKLERSSGPDNHSSLIHPGQSRTFTFDIFGSGFDVFSFTTAMSADTPSGGHFLGLAAAHFVQGVGDDSAFGMTTIVPAPGSVALLLGAFLTVLCGRRRRVAAA